MSSKQTKFIVISKFFELLTTEQTSACVFVHVSDLSTLESNKIQSYCQSSNVKTSYIKINLLKKLSKSNYFTNVLSGPTKLFFFSNKTSLIDFFKQPLIERKCFPLAVFFGGKLYAYSLFFDLVKKMKLQDKNFWQDHSLGICTLTTQINKKNALFIKSISVFFNKTLFLLQIIILQKTKNGNN